MRWISRIAANLIKPHIACTGFLAIIVIFLFTPSSSTRLTDPALGVHNRKPLVKINPSNTAGGTEKISGLSGRKKYADTHAAKWVKGELAPPLPRNPAARNTAVSTAEDAAGISSAIGERHLTGGPGKSFGKTGMRVSALSIPQIRIPERLRLYSHTHPRLEDTFSLEYYESFPDEDIPKFQAPPADFAERTGAARTLLQSFAGFDAYDFQTQILAEPPDCDLAAGLNYIITVTNLGFAIYDKCANEISKTTFYSFLSDTTYHLFDPKVVYDAWDDHWVMSVLATEDTLQESYTVLMVSDTDDPTGSWHWWYLDFTVDGSNPSNNWADYDDISTDPNGIFITTNQFGWTSGFKYSKIRSLDKTEIYSFAASPHWWDFWDMNNAGTLNGKAFSLRPAKMHTWPGFMYFINSKPLGGGMMTLWEQTGTPLSPTLNKYKINVSSYNDPPPLEQADTTFVDAGDSRLCAASYGSGHLWTAASVRCNWGESTDRSCVRVYQIDAASRSLFFESGNLGDPGLSYSYPSVDFDDFDRGIVTFARGGPSEFIGTWYADIGWGTPFSSPSQLSAGTAHYNGCCHTGLKSDPFRWGDYYGCDTDPTDGETIWFFGEHATSLPSINWGTTIGSATYEQTGGINVTPAGVSTSTGLEGGPFTPPSISYTLYNPWLVSLNWDLTGLNVWNSASVQSGRLLPHTGIGVDVAINSAAQAFGPGTYLDYYSFSTCYGFYTGRGTELTIGESGLCPGAMINMAPNIPVTGTNPSGNTEMGAFVTAIADFDVCSVGMKADLVVPQTITARIYEATGTTRGALVAMGSINATTPGNVITYIPVSASLQACKDYDIAVTIGNINGYDYWLEYHMGTPYIDRPIDIGGVLRIKDGENNGNAVTVLLPHLSIIGSVSCDSTVSLAPAGVIPTFTSYLGSGDRGIYVTPKKTVSICSLGWKANLVPGHKLTANIYKGTGYARDSLIATGTIDISSSGEQFYDVPINAVLEEGRLYDLAVSYDTTAGWNYFNETAFTLPFDAGGVLQVEDGEYFGGAFTTVLPEFRASWNTSAGYSHFDLAKQGDVIPPTYSTSNGAAKQGMYVTSLIDQDLYSLGWKADIPEGQTITANVYAAAGITRDSLISSGSVISSGSGMRWHDIPVTQDLAAGGDYDFEIVIPQVVNEYRYWPDFTAPALPYDAYGVLRVRDAERYGNAANSTLIYMRMNACSRTLTSVDDGGPLAAPRFYMDPLEPNPTSGLMRIRFGLDKPARMTLSIYDVAGRKVMDIISGENEPVGYGEKIFNTSKLASGVYFVRLKTAYRSLSRKMVVIH